jgi:hypothetical protein
MAYFLHTGAQTVLTLDGGEVHLYTNQVVQLDGTSEWEQRQIALGVLVPVEAPVIPAVNKETTSAKGAK